MAKICIDAGHGGKDPGAVGFGRLEKDDVLKFSLALGRELSKYGHQIHYTRTTDTYEGVTRKANEANSFGANLMVSNHRNAGVSSANGYESLVYKTSGLAYAIALDINAGMRRLGFRDRGVKVRTDLAVLRRTNMPSILPEWGFISNSSDNAKYDQHFNDMVLLTVRAINKQFGINTTPDPDPTPSPSPTPTPEPVSGDTWILRLQKECNLQGFSNQPEDNIKGPKTLAGCPTLRRGAQGNITKLLQERLASFGYAVGGVDGVFGIRTLNSVTAFQQTEDLVADGIVGKRTWSELIGL